MNTNKEDVGVLKDYTLDLEFGSENNFECTVNSNNHVCDAGFYLYYENAEYGGVIDSIAFNTEGEEVVYKGRTWHGILESKILEPDKGADYLIVEGDANTVLSFLISRMGLDGLFKVSTAVSGINISYQMNRYVGGYTGIMKMLKKHGAKLYIEFKKGFVELSAKPLIDYSQDEQFDTDQITFDIQKNYQPINHVICLGKGELKNRRVIHVYADKEGNISGTQTLTGLEEVSATYENANAESDDELSQGGIDLINASWSADTVDFSFDSDKETFDVGDIIGAVERTTGAEVRAYITKKIVNISKGTTSIQYGCNASAGASSGGFPSSGGGGEGGGTITVDSELSDTSENPVQNKVVTKALESKADNCFIPLFGTTKGRGHITDALNVDLVHVDGELNRVGYVYAGGTVNLPTDCAAGIREVYYYNSDHVFVKINGIDVENKFSVWGNIYAVTTWTGWMKSGNHNHDDRYYTELEVNSLLANKQDILSKVKIREDGEGGNIRIYSPNNNYTEIDMYNDTYFRMYQVNSEGKYVGHIRKTINTTVDLDHLHGVTSNVQTQLNGKQNTLEVTNGGATRNTTYTTNGSVTWGKYGKLVIVDIYDLKVTNITKADQTTNILFSGLPQARHYAVTNLVAQTAGQRNVRIGIDGYSTNIVVWWDNPGTSTTSALSGQLMYFAVNE